MQAIDDWLYYYGSVPGEMGVVTELIKEFGVIRCVSIHAPAQGATYLKVFPRLCKLGQVGQTKMRAKKKAPRKRGFNAPDVRFELTTN